jgi:TPR repeat protein
MRSLAWLLRDVGDARGAATWLRRAAGHGNDEAMFDLGVLHHALGEEGLALQWWQQAAAAGNLKAIHNLGRLLAAQGGTVAPPGTDG